MLNPFLNDIKKGVFYENDWFVVTRSSYYYHYFIKSLWNHLRMTVNEYISTKERLYAKES